MLMRGGRLAAVAVGVSLLGACSQVPDAINPVEWYKSSVEFFTDDEEQAAQPTQADNALVKDRGKAPPGADKEFPSIASVDQQRDYHEARKRGGLVADTEGRKYAPAIARQGEPSSRLAASPPSEPKSPPSEPKVAEQQPAPPASPKAPVTMQQAGLAPPAPPKAPPPPVSSKAPAAPQQARLAPPSGPGAASLPPASGQKAFQARLQKRLDEIRARAGRPPAGLPAAMAGAIAPDNFGTVIINSMGVSVGQAGAPAANPAAVNSRQLAANPQLALNPLTRLARPLAAGAVKVATIHFPNGSAALTARDRQIIAEALQLKRERGGRIHIIGHASSRTRSSDPIRHKMVNFKVSADRADAVARELIRLGVKKEELAVDAISDAQPVYFEFMPTGEAGNRRAEIYLES